MIPYLKRLMHRLRILPVLIIVASFGFVVRLGDTYVNLKAMSGEAHAEEAAKPEDKKPEDKAADKPAEKTDSATAKTEVTTADTQPSDTALKSETDKKSDDTKADTKIDLPSTDAKDDAEGKKWQDASDGDIDNSEIKAEVFKDLARRRADLEEKEKKLGEREALLQAAQKELDKKVSEMEGLRDELKDLLKQQTAAEAARNESLVKIYSGMKPKDAARIFNTLDTDILMDVVSHMPESKSAGIIALMDSERAKALTTLLAEQKKLPEVP